MPVWFTRNRWLLTVVFVIAGGALLVWSWQTRDDGWLSGVLVNTGTTLFLFVPLLMVSVGR